MSITSAKEVEFYDTSDEAITYSKGASPAEIYIKRDLETRTDVILNHPDVIGFVFFVQRRSHEGFPPYESGELPSTQREQKSLRCS